MISKAKKNRAVVIVIVVLILALLTILAVAIVNIGCSEILQVKGTTDRMNAYYAAQAGAERLYADLKSREGETITWPVYSSGAVSTQPSGGVTIGTFDAMANTIGAHTFGIISVGTVNNCTAQATVTYGFDSPFTVGYPLGCGGDMTLSGTEGEIEIEIGKKKIKINLKSWVRAEGPLAAGGDITTNTTVQINGDTLPDQDFAPANFWLGAEFDTNTDGNYAQDTNSDGIVTRAEAIAQGKEAAFNDDNKYNSSDNEITEKDAFYYYYTDYLNQPENNKLGQELGIDPDGGLFYYSGDQTFGPWDVPAGTPVIFVDGNVNILFSDTAWWGGATDSTVVATGDITIIQPTNGSDDTMTLVSYGDITTGGIRAFGGVRGEFVAYAHEGFNAYYGGRTDGTIFAEDDIDVDTMLAIPGLLNRDLNKGNIDWSDPANWPLGIPPNAASTTLYFRIKNEVSEYVPRWQRE